MQESTLTVILTICSLFIGALSLVRRKVRALVIIGTILILAVYFKSLVLWGTAGGFEDVFRTETQIAILLSAFLLCVIFNNKGCINTDYWKLLLYTLIPVFAAGLFWLVGGRQAETNQVITSLELYRQLLSVEQKFGWESFNILATHYDITLFFAFVILQLLVWAVVLGQVIVELISRKNGTYVMLDTGRGFSGYVGVLAIFLLPTNFAYVFCLNVLDYFF